MRHARLPLNRHVAEELVALAVETDKIIARMLVVVDRIEDVETKTHLKRSVADLMGAIARDIIFRIEAEYPDLNPDKA